MTTEVTKIVNNLIHYFEKVDYKGWDIFDGLNSKLFYNSFLYKFPLLRLIWIQFFKICPINLRKIARVPVDYNPKALALIISGYINLYQKSKQKKYLETAERLYTILYELKSEEYPGLSWGYNFDWQARAFYVPKYKPNMVCSVFGGEALLDLYENTDNDKYLKQAEDIVDFLVKSLVLLTTENTLCFAYIPGESAVVHNANLLGASYISRLYKITKKQEYKITAEKSVRFSIEAQRPDGAWVYGERKHHQWVDNFHTGYNLTSILSYQENTGDYQFAFNIKNGLNFHLKKHFDSGYMPKYTDQNYYPIDIHNFSQAVITAIRLRKYLKDFKNILYHLIQNSIQLLYDKDKQVFYYRKNRYYANKIPYLRWSQAWMFYALTLYLKHDNEF